MCKTKKSKKVESTITDIRITSSQMLFTFLLFYYFTFKKLFTVKSLLLLNALQIAAVACVNLYKVALVNEQRHTDLNASLKSSRLQSVCSCIALDARL